MIVSFHPCVVADKNILCAGRDPDSADMAWIKQADAVILPQGCRKSLYETAKNNCPHIFPNYDAKFDFPGKIGQSELFRRLNAPFPETKTFLSLDEFYARPLCPETPYGFNYPFIFKFDWGGESDNVFLIETPDMLAATIQRAHRFESTGQCGFLIQEFIPSGNRSLRVVVIGQQRISYWRIQPDKHKFSTGVSKGAFVDAQSDQQLQKLGVAVVEKFCGQSHVDLAGFDLIFPEATLSNGPVFLEINYFFGRTGLGGSEKFYELLNEEITRWIGRIAVLV